MKQQSLASRAVAAVALMIGFYILALAIAGALLALSYFMLRADRIQIRLVFFCVITAGLILWSIVPRRDVFEIPGPELRPEDHPELFEELRQIAQASEQEMPSEVYLINDVNAWVSQRGGVMGFGSRRVMGLGLPLMHATTLSQFRAIVAHEFGHYDGGDTSLGPWIYKTRGAIGRTLEALGGGMLQKPFEWYGNLFMRITQAISRAQELAADRLAARIAGAKNSADALVAVHAAAVAYDAYFSSEFLPLLSHGFRAPIAAGFSRFVGEEQVRTQISKSVDTELREGKGDIYDSHPPLRERVAALGELQPGLVDANEPLASTLLGDLHALEGQLVRQMLVDPAMQLQDVSWDETGTRVFLPAYRRTMEEHTNALRSLTAGDLPRIGDANHRFWSELKVEGEQRTDAAVSILGCALSARLQDTGWMCDAAPGKPIAFTRDGKTILPFTAVAAIARGELTAEAWAEQCRDAGIAELTLVE